MKILALGPAGTNGHEAATQILQQLQNDETAPAHGEDFEIEFCESHATIFRRFREENCLAVVPIENSTAGLVADTVHGFWLRLPQETPTGAYILGEVELPIEHVLTMRPHTTLDDCMAVLSHPQALSQCRAHLQLYSLTNLISTKSTAAAGALVAHDAEHKYSAALVSPFAAALYGLQILSRHMEDETGNVTRFHLLGHESRLAGATSKTALIFWTQDRPRALMNALWAISADGANMTSIHSLPLGTPGQYAFYVEFNEHVHTEKGLAIMSRLKTVTDRIFWLGSFPQGRPVLERGAAT